jgi:hypothetical protein
VATASEITEVRENTAEPTTVNYSDVYVSALIDVSSVAFASGTIWRRKAAKYAELVDVSEAGASRKMSDLFEHALKMAAYWEGVGTDEEEAAAGGGHGHVRVHTIKRIE